MSPAWRNGREAPIFCEERELANVYDKERTLEQEISGKVAEALPGVEVLAVELTGPERFTVYIDRAEGVDHALCERVTHVLSDYLRTYSVAVSSPGLERPLRKPEHFQRVVGRRVKLKTAERSKLRGEVTRADASAVTVAADAGEVDIPYEQIVRGNLIDEGER
ncbi:MAG: ribosome maturation factor RimP [Actinobacteria bacterium]|nr:MAG: ribosome maturation factor RimP [Actinomycetota bacterium]